MIDDYKLVVEASDEFIFLMMRVWSGFTAPEKYKILLLNEDEITLQGGRFLHYKQELYVDNKQKFLFQLFTDHQHIKTVFDWIGENIKHPWAISLVFQQDSSILNLRNMFTFEFQEPSDAVLFKLKW